VLPQTRSWIKGPTSKGRRGEETETGREGQEREGEGKGAWSPHNISVAYWYKLLIKTLSSTLP